MILKTSLHSYLDVHDWSSHIIFIGNLWKNKIAIVIISFVIIFSWTFINQYLSFSKFKLYDYNDKFIVYNGLLDSDRNMMQKSNIIGLEITETVGQKFLNLMSISVLLVNGDQGRSLAGNQLLPYIPKSKSDYLIDKYLNEFIYSYRLVSNGTNKILKKINHLLNFFILCIY